MLPTNNTSTNQLPNKPQEVQQGIPPVFKPAEGLNNVIPVAKNSPIASKPAAVAAAKLQPPAGNPYYQPPILTINPYSQPDILTLPPRFSNPAKPSTTYTSFAQTEIPTIRATTNPPPSEIPTIRATTNPPPSEIPTIYAHQNQNRNEIPTLLSAKPAAPKPAQPKASTHYTAFYPETLDTSSAPQAPHNFTPPELPNVFAMRKPSNIQEIPNVFAMWKPSNIQEIPNVFAMRKPSNIIVSPNSTQPEILSIMSNHLAPSNPTAMPKPNEPKFNNIVLQGLQNIVVCFLEAESRPTVDGRRLAFDAALKAIGILRSIDEGVCNRIPHHLYFIHKNEKPYLLADNREYGTIALTEMGKATNEDRIRAVKRTIVETALKHISEATSEVQVREFLDILEGLALDPRDTVPGKAANIAHFLQGEIYVAYVDARKLNSSMYDPNDWETFRGDFGRNALRGDTNGRAFTLPLNVKQVAVNTVLNAFKAAWKTP